MIIITGASDGLGKEIAKILSEKGKTVINVSRRNSKYATHNFLTDLTLGREIEKTATEILKLDEPIEALINCAGVYSEEELTKISETEIKRVMAVNVEAPILMTSRLIDRITKDSSDIVNVSSTVGTKAYIDQALYGTSKWALRGFSQNLQLELKDTKCRVISYCPGGFQSNLVKHFNGKSITDPANWMRAEDLAAYLIQILELPKIMEVSEVLINRKKA